MAKLSHLLRVAIAFTLALPLIAVAGSPASAARTVTAFFADYTHTCAYSYTRGTLDWDPITVGGTPQVDVAGALVDDPTSLCDRRHPGEPLVWFTAYVDGVKVDDEIVSLDLAGSTNQPVRWFAFSLSAAGRPDPIIDRVDVRVCRTAGPMLPAFSCGERQTYRRAQIGPAD